MIPGHIIREKMYTQMGLAHLQAIESILNDYEQSLFKFKKILDFACGNARLTWHLANSLPNAVVYGCDVDEKLVGRCQTLLPDVVFFVNSRRPPLAMPDSSLDFILSFSLFTHLTETNHIDWLREFNRLLRPNGLMLHTVHGYSSLRQMALFTPESLKKYRITEPLDIFIQQPFRYHFALEHPDCPEYGYTIISRDYIENKWETYAGMRLLEIREAAAETPPEGCHDFVLLHKT